MGPIAEFWRLQSTLKKDLPRRCPDLPLRPAESAADLDVRRRSAGSRSLAAQLGVGKFLNDHNESIQADPSIGLRCRDVGIFAARLCNKDRKFCGFRRTQRRAQRRSDLPSADAMT
jgi:hypothetical protein